MQNQRGGFSWQAGSWRVRHRKLRERLTGSTDWMEFRGTCRAWDVLGGDGNVEDNVLDDPTGAYTAMAVRRIDPANGEWLIWWFDSRHPDIDAPMRGHFHDGTGLFFADIVFRDRPTRIRFIWSGMEIATPRWEQAFSADEGATWETNWIMDFERADSD